MVVDSTVVPMVVVPMVVGTEGTDKLQVVVVRRKEATETQLEMGLLPEIILDGGPSRFRG